MSSTVTIESAFAELPSDLKVRIAQLAVERSLRSGEVLFRAGDRADGLYVVLSGRIRVSRTTETRLELLHTEGPGGVLGVIPVFGGGTFPATAVAIDPSRCAKLPIEAVERLLRESPDFARFAIRRLAQRAQSLIQRIDELTAMTIPVRVAQFVLGRATQHGEFTLGVSQSTLAEELGTAREVVVRAIGDLVRAGAIERAGRSRFLVTNMETLRALAKTSRD